jgi:predicted AlkP superfamily phosphohydrolase/phosphomutase
LFNKLSKFLFRIVPLEKLVRSSIGRKFILSGGEKKNIDFSQTTAVYHSVCSRGIRILNKEEMTSNRYEALRTELMQLFTGLKDPESGLNIVKKLYRWEEIYGENAVNSPLDLILDMEPGYGVQELLQVPEKAVISSQSSQDLLPVLSPPGFYDWVGDHAPEGTLFVYGKEIKTNHHVSASVTDIVPTVLAYLNVPISDQIDGVVLQDVFQSPLSFSKVVWESKGQQRTQLSEAELKKIRELRLKL